MEKGILDLGGIRTILLKKPKDDQILKIKIESPLDLSVKPISPMTDFDAQSPLKKRYRDTDNIENTNTDTNNHSPIKKRYRDDIKNTKIITPIEEVKQEKTPKRKSSLKSVNIKATKNHPKPSNNEKSNKAIRKLKFDEFRSSPVSGTIIRTLDEIEDGIHESGDIDPQFNIVEITDEAKNELAQIKNIIGAYQCKLCTLEFEDAFLLAMHRCTCIVLIDYRCPECGKKFNCPANLASHRRWHKPRDQNTNKKSNAGESESSFSCQVCGKNFKRQAYLNKHLALHNKKIVNDKKDFDHVKDLLIQNSRSNHDSNDVLIPQSVYKFNREATPSTCNSENDLIIDENSNSSTHYNIDSAERNFKIISSHFTEDESIAISALTNLRNSSSCSVIRHTLTI